jgi:uncharacterized protein YdbL (DUF1318 family)
MDEDPRATGAQVSEGGGTRSPDEIRADIEQTREEVGDTVEALAAKTDVKAQARQRVDEVKSNLHAKTDQVKAKVTDATPASAQAGGQTLVAKVRENPTPFVLGGAMLLAFVIGRRTAGP